MNRQIKRICLTLLVLGLSLLLITSCSKGASTQATATPATTATAAPASAGADNAALKGEVYKTDRFSITVPDGWEKMDVQGGVQLYKMSGEIIEVHYRGENQSEDHAKQQAESVASQYGGTDPKEVELLGKTFWTTTYTASGVKQTSYLRMENGEMLSVKCAGANHETDPVFAAILQSIEFE